MMISTLALSQHSSLAHAHIVCLQTLRLVDGGDTWRSRETCVSLSQAGMASMKVGAQRSDDGPCARGGSRE